MKHNFVSETLQKIGEVDGLEWLSTNLLRIVRTEKGDFDAGVLWEKLVKVEHVEPLIEEGAQFISNVPKIGLWAGDAINFCEARGVAWGRLGALMAACSDDDPSTHQDSKIRFPRRALSQHSRCVAFDFVYDQLFKITLDSGKTLRVAIIDTYDVSADDLREARARLGKFDVALKGNPNGSIYPEARRAAVNIGAEVMMIGELMRLMAKGG